MLAALAPLAGAAISAGTSIYAGNQNAKHQSSLRAQELAHQKEFAQNGIQWKVADAKAAGVHPLFALGASTHSYSPMAIGNSPVAEAMASAGQDIGRAVSATASQSGRMSSAMAALGLERAKLENDLLKTQIMKTVQPSNPAMPSPSTQYLLDGQGDVARPGLAPENKAGTITGRDPTGPYAENHSIPGLGFEYTPTGGLRPVPSKDIKDRIEDMGPLPWIWTAANYAGPNLGSTANIPPQKPRPGHEWYWQHGDQAWHQRPVRTKGPRPWWDIRH